MFAFVAMNCCAGARVELFNGCDLAGWTAVVDHDVTGGYSACEPTWFVTNGTIRTTGTPFGYLRAKRDAFDPAKPLSGISMAKGAIALQAEGGAVEFRNIWVE